MTGWTTPTELVSPAVLLAIAVGLGVQFVPRGPGRKLRAVLDRMHPVSLGLLSAVVLFAITTMGPRGVAPFIYFQF